jgi:hypothetical protein
METHAAFGSYPSRAWRSLYGAGAPLVKGAPANPEGVRLDGSTGSIKAQPLKGRKKKWEKVHKM